MVKPTKLELVTLILFLVALGWFYNIKRNEPRVTVTFEAVKEAPKKESPIVVTKVNQTQDNKGNFAHGYIKGDGSPSQPKKWKR